MRARLPPLTALRAFEAAARHLSATRAAEELCVTQGAISRQISHLESVLDVALFTRSPRKLNLTLEGEAYYRAVAGVFDEIADATAALKSERRRVLRISVLPTISSFWLIPRLAAFSDVRSDADVRIINSIDPVDFRRTDVDLAIRVGRAPGETYAAHQPRIEMSMVTDWQDVQSDMLFADVLTPVCSQAYADAAGLFDTVADLDGAAIIHVTTRRYAWYDWMNGHGRSCGTRGGSLHFGHFFMALGAARPGKGVAMVPTALLRHYEGAGDLVSLFPSTVESAGHYRVLVGGDRAHDPVVQSFRRWLLEQARRDCQQDGWPLRAAPARSRGEGPHRDR